MADLGIAELGGPEFGAYLHVTSNHVILGGNIATVDKVINWDARAGNILPVYGQLWPRPVWQYNDYLAAPPSILGIVHRLYAWEQTGIIKAPIIEGQLWPRGDYIANGVY